MEWGVKAIVGLFLSWIESTYKKYVVSLLVGILVFTGIVVLVKYKLSLFNGKLSNCLVLRGGNINVKLEYPDFFSSGFTNNQIRVLGPNDKGFYTLVLSSEFYNSVDSIISDSYTHAGSKYSTSSFNGYEAAFIQNKSVQFGTSSSYVVPFGNRVVIIDYNPTNLTDNEKKLADKMIQNINFQLTSEDIRPDRVEECSR